MHQYNSDGEDRLDPNLINELPSIPIYKTNTNQSVLSATSDYNYSSLYQETLAQKIWRGSRIAIWILSWWLGAGGAFAYFEEWEYFDGLYFAFVSMTGVGYGDFTVVTPVGIEVWWIFLFNSVRDLNLTRLRFLLLHFLYHMLVKIWQKRLQIDSWHFKKNG
jgi:Ion channel